MLGHAVTGNLLLASNLVPTTYVLNVNKLVAVFDTFPVSPQVNQLIVFNASGSATTFGNITNYSWDFGDGNFGNGINPTHTFTNTGSSVVELTVTNDSGDIEVLTKSISVIPETLVPIANFTIDNNSLIEPGIINFDATASSDPDGSIVNYSWDFGDGNTSDGNLSSHTFDSGSFNVSLTVTDNQGATNSSILQVDINSVPVANFSATPLNGDFPLVVNFDATTSTDSDGTISNYSWDFGDTSSDTGVTTSHTFTTVGSFDVELTITDDSGATNTKIVTINTTSPNILPIANFTQSSVAINEGEFVSFDALTSSDPDGTLTSILWDFGDGETDSGPQLSHVFNTGGVYAVTLTVIDDRGGVDTKTVNITVNHAPIANFSTDVITGDFPLLVNFDASSSSDIEAAISNYAWEFSDSTNDSGVNVSHIFTSAGNYNAKLIVTDSNGVNSEKIVSINVLTPNILPIANFTKSLGIGYAPLIIDFDASISTDSDGTISNYSWDFGGLGISSGVATSFSFDQVGIHNITLTITDDRGGIHNISKTIEILDPMIIASKKELALFENETSNLSAKIYDQQGNGLVGNIEWHSDNSTIATISNSGIVNAINIGTCEFWATSRGGISERVLVEVKDASSLLTLKNPEGNFVGNEFAEIGVFFNVSSFTTKRSITSNRSPLVNREIGNINLPIHLVPGSNDIQYDVEVNGVTTIFNQIIPYIDGFNRYLQFDGINDEASIKSDVSLAVPVSWSISIWLRPNSSGEIINLPVTGGEFTFSIVENLSPKLNFTSSIGNRSIIGPELQKDTWSFISITYDQTSKMMKLFRNGRLFTSLSNIENLVLPTNLEGSIGTGFKGAIDELRFYNLSLTEFDIDLNVLTPMPSSDTRILRSFSFDSQGQRLESEQGSTNSIILGKSIAFEESDPINLRSSEIIAIGDYTDASGLELSTTEFSFEISENNQLNEQEVLVTKVSSLKLDLFPTAMPAISDFYGLHFRESLWPEAIIELKFDPTGLDPLDQSIHGYQIRPEKNQILQLNPIHIDWNRGLARFRISFSGNVWVSTEQVFNYVYTSPLVLANSFLGSYFKIFSIEETAVGTTPYSVDIDATVSGADLTNMHCNGIWESSALSFPLAMSGLNIGENNCSLWYSKNIEGYLFQEAHDFKIFLE